MPRPPTYNPPIPATGRIMRKANLALVGLLVLSAAACKKGGSGKDDLQLVPKEAEVLFRLNLEKLRAAPAWKNVIELRDSNEKSKKEYADFVQKCGLDPFTQISSVFLAVPQIQNTGMKEFAVVMRGTFNEAKLVECATNQAKERGGEVKSSDYNGKKIYSDGKKDEAFVTFLDDKTVVLGGKEWVKKVVDLAKADGEHVGKSEALAPLAKKVKSSDALWFAGLVPQNMRDAMKANPAMAWTGSMKAVYGSIDIASGFAGDFNVDNNDEAAAKEMLSKLTEQLNGAKKMPQLTMAGLSGLLEGIKFEQKGATFHATVALNQAQVDDLINRVKALMKSMGQAFGGGGGPPPSMPPQ